MAPANVRIIDLPTYSAELNSYEQLWNLIKHDLGNRVFESVEDLRTSMLPILKLW